MIVEAVPAAARSRQEPDADGRLPGPLAGKIGVGAAAGALPGLLGIGTGGVLVPAFAFLLRAPVRTATAASLTCFCFNALVSSGFKYAQGFVDVATALPLCAGTLVGANLGALLNRRVRSRIIKLAFGLVFTYVSVKFLVPSLFGVTL
jgi:uncharacterized membrane protein YfcA